MIDLNIVNIYMFCTNFKFILIFCSKAFMTACKEYYALFEIGTCINKIEFELSEQVDPAEPKPSHSLSLTLPKKPHL